LRAAENGFFDARFIFTRTETETSFQLAPIVVIGFENPQA
jgi:hypothetical protein